MLSTFRSRLALSVTMSILDIIIAVFLQEYPHGKLAQEAPRIAPCGGARGEVGKVPVKPYTEPRGTVFGGVFSGSKITFSHSRIV